MRTATEKLENAREAATPATVARYLEDLGVPADKIATLMARPEAAELVRHGGRVLSNTDYIGTQLLRLEPALDAAFGDADTEWDEQAEAEGDAEDQD